MVKEQRKKSVFVSKWNKKKIKNSKSHHYWSTGMLEVPWSSIITSLMFFFFLWLAGLCESWDITGYELFSSKLKCPNYSEKKKFELNSLTWLSPQVRQQDLQTLTLINRIMVGERNCLFDAINFSKSCIAYQLFDNM